MYHLLPCLLLVVAVLASACGSDADARSNDPIPTAGDDAGRDDDLGGTDDEPTSVPVATASPSPQPPGEFDASSFTTNAGCGYGFWLYNTDETLFLRLEFNDFDAAASGNVPAVGNVPSVIWSGQIDVGSDLLAHWCSDVIEAGVPDPQVDETWTITDGAITIDGTVPVQTCGPLGATITGLVAESPDGEIVRFADPVTFANNSWGCFAG